MHYAPAVGWFQPSYLLGVYSPSTHRLTSSHHGVLSSLTGEGFLSTSSTQRALLAPMRVPIQSKVLPARCSSSSWRVASTSARSEKRSANEACGTVFKVVVLVLTIRSEEYDAYRSFHERVAS